MHGPFLGEFIFSQTIKQCVLKPHVFIECHPSLQVPLMQNIAVVNNAIIFVYLQIKEEHCITTEFATETSAEMQPRESGQAQPDRSKFISIDNKDCSNGNVLGGGANHLIIILLAVLSGVLFFVLAFVSFVIMANKRRGGRRHRGRRSRSSRIRSESNLSATSYLSAVDSKANNRTSFHGNTRPMSLTSPTSVASISVVGPGSVRIRGQYIEA